MKNEIPIGMTKVKKSKRERAREREDKGDEKEHQKDNAQND